MSAPKKDSLAGASPVASHANDNRQLKLVTFSELHSEKQEPRERLLAPWFLERQRCMVFAQTGIGKSLFVTSLALAIAGGGEVFGWKADKPRKVLIVDGEMDRSEIKQRIEPLLETVSGGASERALSNITVLARDFQGADTRFPDLADPSGQQQLFDVVATLQPEVVILDNASTLFRLDDENAASAIDPLIDLLSGVRSRGAATILVHHSDKHGKTYRGSSKLAATFETIIGLRKRETYVGKGAAFTIAWEKSRSPDIPAHTTLKTALVKREDGSHFWQTDAVKKEELLILVECVESLRFRYDQDIASHLNLSKSEVCKRKSEAFEHKLITEDRWARCMQAARDTQKGDYLPAQLDDDEGYIDDE